MYYKEAASKFKILKQYDKSISVLEKLIDVYEKMNDVWAKARTYESIIECQFLINDHKLDNKLLF